MALQQLKFIQRIQQRILKKDDTVAILVNQLNSDINDGAISKQKVYAGQLALIINVTVEKKQNSSIDYLTNKYVTVEKKQNPLYLIDSLVEKYGRLRISNAIQSTTQSITQNVYQVEFLYKEKFLNKVKNINYSTDDWVDIEDDDEKIYYFYEHELIFINDFFVRFEDLIKMRDSCESPSLIIDEQIGFLDSKLQSQQKQQSGKDTDSSLEHPIEKYSQQDKINGLSNQEKQHINTKSKQFQQQFSKYANNNFNVGELVTVSFDFFVNKTNKICTKENENHVIYTGEVGVIIDCSQMSIEQLTVFGLRKLETHEVLVNFNANFIYYIYEILQDKPHLVTSLNFFNVDKCYILPKIILFVLYA